MTLTFTSGNDSFVVLTPGTYDLEFAGGDDFLKVTTGIVRAHMGQGNDRVWMNGGSATLFGDDGVDRFDLLGGTATVDGGADNDRFNIFGGLNHSLGGGAGDDLFVSYGVATGLQLSGGDGNDRFYGFGGEVTLAGGSGNDLYRVLSSAGPNIVENVGEGIDTIQVARGISYTLGANVENLKVLDALGTGADATLVGNALSNHVTGSKAGETINGMGGNDALSGAAGNDIINGGDGNDRITGGLGSDTLNGGAGRDTFVYGSASESPAGQGSNGGDWIMEWDPADHVDLSGVDANTLIDGNQAFQFAGYSFAQPPSGHAAGTIYIGGFVNQLWIIGFTDDDATPDFQINLFAPQDEGSLRLDNLVL